MPNFTDVDSKRWLQKRPFRPWTFFFLIHIMQQCIYIYIYIFFFTTERETVRDDPVHPRWNYKKANWVLFEHRTSFLVHVENVKKNRKLSDLFIYLFIYLCMHVFIFYLIYCFYLFIYLFTYLYIYSFIHFFIYLYLYLFIYLVSWLTALLTDGWMDGWTDGWIMNE